MNKIQSRQLSIPRIALALTLVVTLVVLVVGAVRRSTRPEPVLTSQWFAPYVDATLTPLYPFEDAAAVPTGQVVLSFVVADPAAPCTPSWGGHYGLDDAATGIDLDRRITRLRQQGRDIAVSFGGAASRELAVACTDPQQLTAAYAAVVDRYHPTAIDLDLEGDALEDVAAHARRATAIAALQQRATSSDASPPVWLTLPVAEDGLPVAARTALDAMLDAGVDVRGVNAMTMNYGASSDDIRPMVRRSLEATVDQVRAAYRAAGTSLTGVEAWRKVGATPMIGLNDTVPQRFDLDAAAWLVDFARERGLGRLSMWSLNRDMGCGANIDSTRPSPQCSGIDQRARAFTASFAVFGTGSTVGVTAASGTADAGSGRTTAATRAPVSDDPAASPYPIWSVDRSYQQGRVARQRLRRQVVLPRRAARRHGSDRRRRPLAPGGSDPVRRTSAGHHDDPVLHPPGVGPETAYPKGSRIQVDGAGYEAKWWTRRDPPGVDVPNDWDTPWRVIGAAPAS